MRIKIESDIAVLSTQLFHIGEAEARAMQLRFFNEMIAADLAAGRKKVVSYDIVFDHHGQSKIECIKSFRHLYGWGLKEAKDASEKGPHVLANYTTRENAEADLQILKNSGASVHIEDVFAVAA